MVRRYTRSFIVYFAVYLFVPLICIAADYLFTGLVRSWLVERFPSVFAEYSQIYDKELYLAQTKSFSAVSALFALFAVNFIYAVYDGDRCESIIRKTNGLFKIKTQIGSCFKENIIPDTVSALLTHLPFVLIYIFANPSFTQSNGFLFSPYINLGYLTGSVLLTYITIAFLTLAARIIATPVTLSRARGRWITSFVDE